MKGGNFNPTPIDRVNKSISIIRLTYKCYYIVITLRTWPIHLTTFWVNIRGLFNPTFIDRVNKLMSNNIRSTYFVIPLWSCQDKSIKPYVIRVNIGRNFDFAPTYRINLVLFWHHIQIELRNLFLVPRDFMLDIIVINCL